MGTSTVACSSRVREPMNCTMRFCLAGHAASAIGQRGSVRLIFSLCLLDGHAQGPQVPSIYNISMRSTPDIAPCIQWGWISLKELLPPFALTSLNSFSPARSFLRRTRLLTRNTHTRDARRIFIYIHGDISIWFTAAYAFFPTPTTTRWTS